MGGVRLVVQEVVSALGLLAAYALDSHLLLFCFRFDCCCKWVIWASEVMDEDELPLVVVFLQGFCMRGSGWGSSSSSSSSSPLPSGFSSIDLFLTLTLLRFFSGGGGQLTFATVIFCAMAHPFSFFCGQEQLG